MCGSDCGEVGNQRSGQSQGSLCRRSGRDPWPPPSSGLFGRRGGRPRRGDCSPWARSESNRRPAGYEPAAPPLSYGPPARDRGGLRLPFGGVARTPGDLWGTSRAWRPCPNGFCVLRSEPCPPVKREDQAHPSPVQSRSDASCPCDRPTLSLPRGAELGACRGDQGRRPLSRSARSLPLAEERYPRRGAPPRGVSRWGGPSAPPFEPRTFRLTADRSTAELRRHRTTRLSRGL